MKVENLRHLQQNARRVGEIVGVLAKYGLADWFKDWHVSWIQSRIQTPDGRPIPDLKPEERVRLAFIELGPTFIKLGQTLSTRPDFVGPEMARELTRLQVATVADPPPTVRATIEAELGRPLRGFGFGDCTPMEADSLDCTERWKGGALPASCRAPVRLAFSLRQSVLYAWQFR